MTNTEYWGKINPEKAENLEQVLNDIVNDKSLNLKIKEKYFVGKDGTEHSLNEGFSIDWQHDICHYLGKKNQKVKILIGWSTIPILTFGSISIDYKGNVEYEKKWYHFGDAYSENFIKKQLELEGLLKSPKKANLAKF